MTITLASVHTNINCYATKDQKGLKKAREISLHCSNQEKHIFPKERLPIPKLRQCTA